MVFAAAAFALVVVMMLAAAALALVVVMMLAAAALAFVMVVMLAAAALVLVVVVMLAAAAFVLVVVMVFAAAAFVIVMMVVMAAAAAALIVMMMVVAAADRAGLGRKGFLDFRIGQADLLQLLAQDRIGGHAETALDRADAETRDHEGRADLLHHDHVAGHVVDRLGSGRNRVHRPLVIHEEVIHLELAKLLDLHLIGVARRFEGSGKRLALRKGERDFLHAGKKHGRRPGARGKKARKGNHLAMSKTGKRIF